MRGHRTARQSQLGVLSRLGPSTGGFGRAGESNFDLEWARRASWHRHRHASRLRVEAVAPNGSPHSVPHGQNRLNPRVEARGRNRVQQGAQQGSQRGLG